MMYTNEPTDPSANVFVIHPIGLDFTAMLTTHAVGQHSDLFCSFTVDIVNKGEVAAWSSALAAKLRRQHFGMLAPKRRRPARVQRKIDARFGYAKHPRDVDQARVRAEVEAVRREWLA
jgi:hypothetical protein